MIQNPILHGFSPDPSWVRVGEDYYIAVSTFEWFPGVRIFHSRDLRTWRLHSYALTRPSQLDMRGVCNGGGVWAPCLTHDGELFHLVYTIVRERGAMMQTDNYLVTTPSLDEGWSEPVFLNSVGFDPSLFHDSDGRKWLLNLNNHYMPGTRFHGLWIQEYDAKNQCLIGESRKIYSQKEDELVEGAHLYHLNGWYYLLKAQGGTGTRHSAQLSRSRSLMGPYEDCPFILLHSRDNPQLEIQQAGHADLLQTPDGAWYLVHLGARRDSPCTGRETCLQRVVWTEDGWLRLAQGGETPHVAAEEPSFPPKPLPPSKASEWQSLRIESDSFVSMQQDTITLRGGDSLMSTFSQSLLARRVTEPNCTAEVTVSFSPTWEKQMAGLVFLYDTHHWHYLAITRSDSSHRRVLRILSCDGGTLSCAATDTTISDDQPVKLRGELCGTQLRFFYDLSGTQRLLTTCDASLLSDHHVPLGFTGAMVGLCCQDLGTRRLSAEFRGFRYHGVVSLPHSCDK